MAETKEDIQAQIDKLRLEWLRNLDGYKIKYLWGSLITPVSGSPLDIFWRLVLGIVYPAAFIVYLWKVGPFILEGFNGEDTVPLIFTLPAGLVCIIGFPILLRGRRKFLKAAGNDDEALRAYESKRAELQAKLDALD